MTPISIEPGAEIGGVLVIGDTHGDRRIINHVRHRLRSARRRKQPNGLLAVVQVGDFGIYDTDGSRTWTKMLNRTLELEDAFCWFVDGNHDGHDLLGRGRPPGGIGPSGEHWYRNRIAWIPRGTVWQWGGRLLGGMGGAVSVDRNMRHEGFDYFREEKIDPMSVQRLAEGCNGRALDALFAHDTPLREITWSTGWRIQGELADRCAENRAMVAEAVDLSGAGLVIHGHYHLRRREIEHIGAGQRQVTVECLNMAPRNGSAGWLDLSDMSFEDLDSVPHITGRR